MLQNNSRLWNIILWIKDKSWFGNFILWNLNLFVYGMKFEMASLWMEILYHSTWTEINIQMEKSNVPDGSCKMSIWWESAKIVIYGNLRRKICEENDNTQNTPRCIKISWSMASLYIWLISRHYILIQLYINENGWVFWQNDWILRDSINLDKL